MIGCECPVCRSTNAKNHRTRSSVVLGFPEGNLLIDTAPDLRTQFLREDLQTVHAILYTHAHVDHLFGLDDTRLMPRYNEEKPLPIFCDENVSKNIHHVFSYIFDPEVQQFPAGGIPKLDIHIIRPYEEVEVLGGRVLPLTLLHGTRPILGYRIGNLAYCTDVKTIPPETEERLTGLDTLIIGCLRYKPHPTHMGLDEVLQVIERLRPKQTWFTHLAHDFEHEQLCSELPENVRPAFDGLRLEGVF